MRVFLDSNVLVSAFATRGLSADLLRLVLSEHDFVTAEVVLQEVERVLRLKFSLPTAEVEEIVSFLREYPVEPRPSAPTPVPISDPDDAWVLASALAAGAEVLITGDAALLELGPHLGALHVTNPRGFWQLHRQGEP